MQFGPFEFHASARRLCCGSEDIHLTPKAFDLLAMLIAQAPDVVSKDEIYARLWPNQAISDATLAGLVKEIRRALKAHSPECKVIRTVHRVGFAFDSDRATPAADLQIGGLLFIGQDRVTLTERLNVVGRNPECAVWIADATVSREHARIVIESGRVVLEDLGSKNGTRVNGEPLQGSCELNDGDDVQFGEIDTVFRHPRSFHPTRTQATRGDL